MTGTSRNGNLELVEIAGVERIAEFAKRFPSIKNALTRWVSAAADADWRNPAEMKRTFGSADVVGGQTVFNVGGNKCRLIALIHYRSQRIFVRHVLTHLEYDKGDWKL